MSTGAEQSRRGGRPRWWLVGLVLCLLAGGGLLARSLADDTYVASVSPPPTESARPSLSPGQAAGALEQLEEALRSADPEAAERLAPEDDAHARAWLRASVDNADALRLDDISLRYLDDDHAPNSTGDWTAAVDLTWRYRGFDRRAAHAEVTFALRDLGDRVGLVGLGEGRARVAPLWLQGPLEVRRTHRTLVAVAGSPDDARRYDRLARRAVPVVRAVLPRWRGGLVVEVPATTADLDRTLGSESGLYAHIAAVTTSTDGSPDPGAPVHVFVNPDAVAELREIGAQVVMSHEATHVATGAWTSEAPLWLLEGFADYVALRDVDAPLSVLASEAIDQVRAEGLPRRLPTARDFGTRSADLRGTYEMAWLAARLLARGGGEAALVGLHRAVQAGQPLAAALRETHAMTVQQLTRAWRAELRAATRAAP